MTDNALPTLQARTDAKLRYARVHLDELKGHGPLGGDDFDKAHQESFLFQLLGARDAFLHELARMYVTGLDGRHLSLGRLRDSIATQGHACPEVSALYELEQDETSWYRQAKDFRDFSTHVQAVSRAYHLGGPDHQKVKLRHPVTGELSEAHFVDAFEDWIAKMEALISKLRQSAAISTGVAS